MSNKNIFSNIRREVGTDDLFWLRDDYNTWDTEELPIYFGGFRGAGKTTILQSFHWRNRINNVSLKNELCKVHGESYEKLEEISYLKDVAFRNKMIGIYHSVLSFTESHFSNWEYKNNQSAYSAYFECKWLSKLIDAISALRNNQIIEFTRNDEKLVVKYLLYKYPSLKEITNNDEHTLTTLKDIFESIWKLIFFASKINENLDASSETFLKEAVSDLGIFLHSVTNVLLLLCETKGDIDKHLDSHHGILKETKWRFCICIDYDTMEEKNLLSKQKLINSIVVAKTPHEINSITYRIAGLVGYLDHTSSFEYTLSEADRKYLEIHKDIYDSHSKFQSFIDGVLKVRIKDALSPDKLPQDFESKNCLKLILGKKSLNENTFTLNKDEFKKANEPNFLNEMEKYAKSSNEIPPLWEKYVDTKRDSDNYNLPMNHNRRMNVSATLCLCNEYELNFPYIGYSVLIGISDKSIRVCLQLLNSIYEMFISEKKGNLSDFVSNEIESKIQHRAIKNYTSHSINDLKYGINDPDDKRLFNSVLSLSEITHHIQTSIDNKAYLDSEKGWFKVNYSSDDDKFIENINLCTNWGCIITDGFIPRKGTSGQTIFRISNRYAAFPPLYSRQKYTDKNNYSYRGAPGNKDAPVEISVDNFLNLFSTDDNERKRAVKTIVNFQTHKEEVNRTLNEFFD